MHGQQTPHRRTGSRFPDPLRSESGDGIVSCRGGEIRIRTAPGGFLFPLEEEPDEDGEFRRGDLLVVEPRSPLSGDFVLALVEGESRIFRAEGVPPGLRLRETGGGRRRFTGNDLVIQGVVVALIRRFR